MKTKVYTCVRVWSIVTWEVFLEVMYRCWQLRIHKKLYITHSAISQIDFAKMKQLCYQVSMYSRGRSMLSSKGCSPDFCNQPVRSLCKWVRSSLWFVFFPAQIFLFQLSWCGQKHKCINLCFMWSWDLGQRWMVISPSVISWARGWNILFSSEPT